MKAALIGDVHANLPALEAVLADAESRGVEAVWNVGDFVGYGAFPDEVVRRLQQPHVVSIVGNYDLKVLKFPSKKAKWKKAKQAEKYRAFKWAHKHLSEASREHLRSLPRQIRLDAEGWRVLLTHASPASNTEPLLPDTPDARLRELAQTAEADVVVCGHSHVHFVRQLDGVWFINTGTVGRPDDGDPRACYATLDLAPERLDVHHHRVAYDTERAAAAIRAQGLPAAFAEMVLHGRSLDVVAAQPARVEASPSEAGGTMELEHVGLDVPDPAAMADWYVEHLGMRIVASSEAPVAGRFLADSADHVMLEIYNNPAVEPPDYASIDPLVLHVAFASCDVQGDYERLLAAGAIAAAEPYVAETGDELAMVRDPWGVPVQLARRHKPMIQP